MASNEHLLDKDNSPDQFTTPKVKRLNRKPLLIAFLVGMSIIGSVMYAAMQRNQPKTVKTTEQEKSAIQPVANDPAVASILSSSNSRTPEQQNTIIEQTPSIIPESKPETVATKKTPQPLPTVKVPSPEDIAQQQFIQKVAAMKSEAFLQAVIGNTTVDHKLKLNNKPQRQGNTTQSNALLPANYKGTEDELLNQRNQRIEQMIKASQEQKAKQNEENRQLMDEALARLTQAMQVNQPSQNNNTPLLERIATSAKNAVNQVPINTDHQTAPRTVNATINKNKQPSNTNLNHVLNQLSNPSSLVTNTQRKPRESTQAINQASLNTNDRQQWIKAVKLNETPAAVRHQAAMKHNPNEFIETKRVYGYSTEYRKQPLSDTVLRVGTIIPAILITGINSDLSGEVLAQVSHDVRDTQTGNHVLIPRGSKLIGKYEDKIKNAQNRIGVNWHRLQFPDGSSLELNGMGALDQSGFTGMADLVNNHTLKKYGSAALLSLISASTMLTQNDGGSESASGQLKADLGRSWATLGQKVIEKNLDIPPTIIIRPGYRFNVMVNQDLIIDQY